MMAKNSHIAFLRADGSKTIGMGHLKRVGLLSEMLVRSFQMTPVLITKKDALAETFIRKQNVPVRFLPTAIDLEEEMRLLSEMMARERPCLIFVDLLDEDTNPRYMKIFKQNGAQVVAITDDSRPRSIDADLIVNGNPYQAAISYRGEKGRYLCGTPYFLMDLAYATTKVKEPVGPPSKILVTLGGSDHSDLLFRILQILQKINPDFFVLIITSQATGYLERLKKFLKSLTLKTDLLVDVDSLVSFWNRCDVAITAGGNSLFERIASRLPGATICQLERQNEIAGCFAHMDVNFNLGLGANLSDEEIFLKLQYFLSNTEIQHEQYARAPYVIDGEGLLRLETELKNLVRENAYEL